MDEASNSTTLTPAPQLQKKKWNKSRPPTVNDIRNKVCWICREDEASEEEPPPPTANGKGVRRRRWVHACGCSLVAHQNCLLLWMAMQPRGGPDEMKCPQCKTPFEVISPRNRTLVALEFLHKQVSKGARFTSVVAMTGSMLGLSTYWGLQSLRWFVGRDAAHHILGGEHPLEWRLVAWLQLPLIPLSLILSHTRAAFVPVLPFLLIQPLQHQVNFYATETGGTTMVLTGSPLGDLGNWPPSPPLLLVLYPIVRHFYRRAHSKVVHWLVRDHLCPHVPPPTAGPNNNNNNNADDGQAQVEGEENDAWGFEQNVRDMAQRQLDRNEPITVDMDVIARTFVGSLMLPPLSALLGEVLKRCSEGSSLLRSFLGLRQTNPVGMMTGLNLDGAFVPAGLASMMKIGLGVRRKTFADFDPVWWRNAIGLGLFIVARDAFSLWRKYLTVNNDKKRIVANKPFVNVDYDELDLIID